MKIICYMNMLNYGGAERVMSVLANGLHRLGHDITMVTDYSADNDYPLSDGIERVIFGGDFSGATKKGRVVRTVNRILRLRKLCKQKKADLMISFIEEANSRALLATRGLKTKNLISVRVDPKYLLKKRINRVQINLLYPMADGIVLQTEDARQAMPAKLHKKSRVIINPVSDAFLGVQGTPCLEKRVVSCGRLTGQKRFDLLIDAFDRVCDEFPQYTLEIYGIGTLKERLQNRIDALGRQERIRLMGRCEDMPNAIKNSSLFVLSSDFEGLPNVLMEAMTLSLPVVSTDCGGGGARALIDHGENGLIVPCGNVDALADAIRQNLADPEGAKRRGEQAGEKAKHFCAEEIVAQWEAYITAIVEEKA